jgi:hypothetical protein
VTLTVELSDASVERIAQRLLEIVSPVQSTAELVDARAVAQQIGMSPAWVREHGLELGGVRIGGSPKARWRFDLQTAIRSHERTPAPALPAVASPRRRRPQTDGVRLLPIRP